jgi:hypothetical protein
MDLEPGQKWDDMLSFTLTREQAQTLLTVCIMQMDKFVEGLEDARKAADQGDILAMLVGPALAETAQTVQAVLAELTKVVNPAMWAEVQEEHEALHKHGAVKHSGTKAHK